MVMKLYHFVFDRNKEVGESVLLETGSFWLVGHIGYFVSFGYCGNLVRFGHFVIRLFWIFMVILTCLFQLQAYLGSGGSEADGGGDGCGDTWRMFSGSGCGDEIVLLGFGQE